MPKTKMGLNNKIVKEFLDKRNIIAVVGASDNNKKYGNRVFFDLLNAGYKVYAIHKDNGMLGGHKRYSNLNSLPEKPDVVNIVVPHNVTELIVKECKKLGINKVWMQPGSESQKAIDYCNKNNIKSLYNVCILVKRMQIKKWE